MRNKKAVKSDPGERTSSCEGRYPKGVGIRLNGLLALALTPSIGSDYKVNPKNLVKYLYRVSRTLKSMIFFTTANTPFRR